MEIRQTGAKAIVSALHQVPVGEIWTRELIKERKGLIEDSGLSWSVVESVPVHEDIKLRKGDFKIYIENYKTSIRNLGLENISTLCYNFMPVLDWSRTNLNYKFEDGSESLHFDYTLFSIIDIYILKRPGAEAAYTFSTREKAAEIYEKMSSEERDNLRDSFLLGLPGSGETFSIEEVLERIGQYKDISSKEFKLNLVAFIREIAPVAEDSGVRLAIHPDDPPWSLMGLPKAVSTLADAQDIVQAYNSPNNGITFCTGSFGASSINDLPHMAEVLSDRINFAHLRNVSRDSEGNFHENYFFEGDIDMSSIMKTLVKENRVRQKNDPGFKGIPIRPDHGTKILGDYKIDTYPGYALYGRMKSLAEIRGLEIGISNSIDDLA
jgi:mannonate dehydratase